MGMTGGGVGLLFLSWFPPRSSAPFPFFTQLFSAFGSFVQVYNLSVQTPSLQMTCNQRRTNIQKTMIRKINPAGFGRERRKTGALAARRTAPTTYSKTNGRLGWTPWCSSA
jgi:hypothetical protein